MKANQKIIQFSVAVTGAQRTRKEESGLTWAQIIELGIKTAEEQKGKQSNDHQ